MVHHKTKLVFSTALIGLLLLSGMAGCKKAAEYTGRIVFLKGDVKISGKKAELFQKIKRQDLIQTGDKSTVLIKFGNEATMAIRSQSRVFMQKLVMGDNNLPIISMTQPLGKSLHRIEKGQAQYQIASPTAVAGVRGTAFAFDSNQNETMIRLLHGSVETREIRSGKTLLLKPEQAVVVNEKGIQKPTALKAQEKSGIEGMDNLEEKNGEIQIPAEVLDYLISAGLLEKTIRDGKVILEPNTHLGLRKKYGKLFEVKTTKGLTYIGALREKGDSKTIILPGDGGRIALKSSDIKALRELKDL